MKRKHERKNSLKSFLMAGCPLDIGKLKTSYRCIKVLSMILVTFQSNNKCQFFHKKSEKVMFSSLLIDIKNLPGSKLDMCYVPYFFCNWQVISCSEKNIWQTYRKA